MEAETIRKKGSVPIDAVKWSERTSCDDSSPSSPQKGLAARISAPPDLSHKQYLQTLVVPVELQGNGVVLAQSDCGVHALENTTCAIGAARTRA
eukprot:scaffold64125_cov21-Tisochrysis_lutea.AAC.2